MKTTPPSASIHAFLHQVERAKQSVLLLDYDGTLAPFRPDRHRALPYPGVTNVLSDIMETGRTRVVLITGT